MSSGKICVSGSTPIGASHSRSWTWWRGSPETPSRELESPSRSGTSARMCGRAGSLRSTDSSIWCATIGSTSSSADTTTENKKLVYLPPNAFFVECLDLFAGSPSVEISSACLVWRRDARMKRGGPRKEPPLISSLSPMSLLGRGRGVSRRGTVTRLHAVVALGLEPYVLLLSQVRNADPGVRHLANASCHPFGWDLDCPDSPLSCRRPTSSATPCPWAEAASRGQQTGMRSASADGTCRSIRVQVVDCLKSHIQAAASRDHHRRYPYFLPSRSGVNLFQNRATPAEDQ